MVGSRNGLCEYLASEFGILEINNRHVTSLIGHPLVNFVKNAETGGKQPDRADYDFKGRNDLCLRRRELRHSQHNA